MSFRTTELAALHDELVTARAAQRELEHVLAARAFGLRNLSELDGRIAALEEVHRREQADVDALAGPGLSTFVQGLLGRLGERRDEEARELATAAVAVASAREERAARLAELRALDERAHTLGGADARFEAAMLRKAAWLEALDEEAAQHLVAASSREAELRAQLREVDEALGAARAAHGALATLHTNVQSAGNWAAADLFGGGLVSSLAKRSRMDDVARQIPGVQRLVDRMKAECEDVGIHVSPAPLVAGQQGWLLDVFLDNVFTDWGHRRQIGDLAGAIGQAIDMSGWIRAGLEQRRGNMIEQIASAIDERRRIIESDARVA